MKKIVSIIVAVCMTITFTNIVIAKEINTDNSTSGAKSVVLMEASTGQIIKAENENERLSPASITKIMTLNLIFDALKDKKIKLNDNVITSAHAKSMGGSQVFLEEGEQQTVETLIKCIIIASGNDASVAMAEHISGSEEEFVRQMNEKAKALNMNNTHFVDCCGLTESDEHYSSALDVAIMSKYLINNYPEIFKYSTIWMETIVHKTDKGEKEFVLTNTNKLLKVNPYVKGLKTGSTSKAKFCVSNVAIKDGVELISVVMAAPDFKTRFKISESLLNYGFSNCKVYKDKDVFEKKINITNGVIDKVKVKGDSFSYVETKGLNVDKITKEVNINNIKAPISKNDIVGYIIYKLNNEQIGKSPIRALETVNKTNYFNVIKKLFSYMFRVA